MKKSVLIILTVLLCTAAFAAHLSDYPHIFAHNGIFDPIYVIGVEAPSLDVISATALSSGISKYPQLKVKIGTSKIDMEISDVKTYNAIVIGNPCINRAAAQLEGNPEFCFEGLEGGKGYAKFFTNNGKLQLLITGISAKDRKKMAEFLAEGYLGNLNVQSFTLTTNSGSKTPERPVLLSVSNENEENQEIEIEEVEINLEKEIKEAKPKETKITIEEEIEEKPVEKKGFFRRIIDGIANFFKNLFN